MYIEHHKATGLIIKGHHFFEVKNPRQLKPTDGQKSSTASDIVDGCCSSVQSQVEGEIFRQSVNLRFV